MAFLYITECNAIPSLSSWGQSAQAPSMPPVTEQRLAIGGASTPSAAFNANTKFVMLHTDAICSLAWTSDGSNPVAVATAQRMNAGETRFYGVNPNYKVAVITNT